MKLKKIYPRYVSLNGLFGKIKLLSKLLNTFLFVSKHWEHYQQLKRISVYITSPPYRP